MSAKKRKFKVNKYENFSSPKEQLDFHGLGILTPNDIEKLLNDFIAKAKKNNSEKILIITGKGLHSQDGPVVRPLVQRLLQKHGDVRSFSQARVDRGGSGAIEVVLY
jgi:DNA-nicking Smr family endonuclease